LHISVTFLGEVTSPEFVEGRLHKHTMNINIRPLVPNDYEQWLPLWKGYQTFYKTVIADDVTSLTWARFHDSKEPMHVLGAFEGDTLLGITHYIFHRTCWTAAPTCYLQDLFTANAARGKGIGRALIEAVHAAAAKLGCARIYWQTHETNAEAMVLYNKVAERSGFLVYRKSI
jgi:GNAT superfamily N-acetyltransferase